MAIDWKAYSTKGIFDELLARAGQTRPAARTLCQYLTSLTPDELKARKDAAELAIRIMGITFTVYSESGNIDRAWPFDIVPRIIELKEWERTQAGLIQRLRALNHFIHDVYGKQKIFKSLVISQQPSSIRSVPVKWGKMTVQWLTSACKFMALRAYAS